MMADVRGVLSAIERLKGSDIRAAAIELCRFVNARDAMSYLFSRYGVTVKGLSVAMINWTAEVLDDVSPKRLRDGGVKTIVLGKTFGRNGTTIEVSAGMKEDEFKSALSKELKG